MFKVCAVEICKTENQNFFKDSQSFCKVVFESQIKKYFKKAQGFLVNGLLKGISHDIMSSPERRLSCLTGKDF